MTNYSGHDGNADSVILSLAPNPNQLLLKEEPQQQIIATAEVGSSSEMGSVFQCFNPNPHHDSSSSSSPNLNQLGINEFLDPNMGAIGQDPIVQGENSATTMWEDIASSIKKLDPDHADVLIHPSPIAGYNPSSNPSPSSQQSTMLQLMSPEELGDQSSHQDCTNTSYNAMIDAQTHSRVSSGSHQPQQLCDNYSFDQHLNRSFETTASTSATSPDPNNLLNEMIDPQQSAITNLPEYEKVDSSGGGGYSVCPSGGTMVELSPVNDSVHTVSSTQKEPKERVSKSFNDFAETGKSYNSSHPISSTSVRTTIEYKPKYNRRNNPDLEKRRIHFCDHPGTHFINLITTKVVGSFNCLNIFRLYEGLYKKLPSKSSPKNSYW